MLLPEDLAGKSAIHCLDCGQKVGFISYLGPPLDMTSAELASEDFEKSDFEKGCAAEEAAHAFKLRLVTLTVNAKLVQGVVGSKHFVRFECDCKAVSIYHLIL